MSQSAGPGGVSAPAGGAARLQVAQRAAVPPFHVMDLLARAAQRRRTHGDLVNFVAGQPSTPAPGPVRAAAARALEGDLLGYTVAPGIPELREAIARHHRDRYAIDVEADDVVVTTGSSGGFLLAFLAAFEAGDRVAMARPGYACYRNVLTALGCEVVELPTGPESRFQPTVAMLEELSESDLARPYWDDEPDGRTVLDKVTGATYRHYLEHRRWISDLLGQDLGTAEATYHD